MAIKEFFRFGKKKKSRQPPKKTDLSNLSNRIERWKKIHQANPVEFNKKIELESAHMAKAIIEQKAVNLEESISNARRFLELNTLTIKHPKGLHVPIGAEKTMIANSIVIGKNFRGDIVIHTAINKLVESLKDRTMKTDYLNLLNEIERGENAPIHHLEKNPNYSDFIKWKSEWEKLTPEQKKSFEEIKEIVEDYAKEILGEKQRISPYKEVMQLLKSGNKNKIYLGIKQIKEKRLLKALPKVLELFGGKEFVKEAKELANSFIDTGNAEAIYTKGFKIVQNLEIDEKNEFILSELIETLHAFSEEPIKVESKFGEIKFSFGSTTEASEAWKSSYVRLFKSAIGKLSKTTEFGEIVKKTAEKYKPEGNKGDETWA